MSAVELGEFLASEGLLSPRSSEVAGIVDLAGTISRRLGCEPETELPWLTERLSDYRALVFVIVDGLGLEQLARSAPHGFLSRTMVGELRSVFPSTTATALTSFSSASWAGTHGITGWWTHFPHLSRTICALTFRERETRLEAGSLGVETGDLLSVESMYRDTRTEARSYLPSELSQSAYAMWSRADTPIVGYHSPRDAARKVAHAAAEASHGAFFSVYLPQVDATIHKWGNNHAETHAVIRGIDKQLGKLAESLPDDVAMIATADHGLVEVDRSLHTVLQEDHPLLDTLLLPPSGEATSPIFHVRDGAQQEFRETLAATEAGRAMEVFPTDSLADAGFFGPEGIDPLVRKRFGDFIGLAPKPALLEYVPRGFRPVRNRGVHGGLRPGEMRVPLSLVAR